MNINPYKIILEPVLTEKSVNLKEMNKYVFKVNDNANKNSVKQAVETLFKVKVGGVRIVNTKDKKARVGRYEGYRSGWKKAIVTLKEGKIEYTDVKK
ncbi:MAG: 50S ribosomal protein L23 [Elusimicrobiales bacterium]|nr:50S ribosomal protein L23 [Elusimicrobiales bacterium]HOJ86213.1 50S ribosomal protein L23 [Elusimicrobiales bacterium]HOL61861.1 50S ribosomal protein L23 [Elusimicrobiales bacterium]HPO95079.1 50S ribosomal protein L23 [Elusimicrobiales bacterium]